MKITFDVERIQEALATPEKSGLDDVELAVLSTCLELAGGSPITASSLTTHGHRRKSGSQGRVV